MTRETFIRLLGKLPNKVLPILSIIDEVDCGSFLRRTIEYAVEQDERIKAFLCLPHTSTAQNPAIFCHHQHAGNYLLGKSEVVGLSGDKDQAYAKELAERGFITLSPDAICFEDRCQHKDSPENSHVHELHTRLLRGETLLGKILHDMSVGIDILQSLTEVDSDRIGFIGHSYGGRTALFAPVFDRRIKTSVCNGGSSNYRDMSGIQFDFVLPDIIQHGDIEDIVRLVEPTNLLISGSDHDKWSIGIEAMAAYAQSTFHQGEFRHHVSSGGHQFTPEMRERAYAFLSKHLNQPADA